MKLPRLLLIAAMVGAMGIAAPSWAADEARQTVSINDRIPTPDEVENALFPKQIKTIKDECAQVEKLGMRCQSVVPKSSLDSVLVTFARGSAGLSDEAKNFLASVGAALQRRVGQWSALRIEGHTDATGTRAVNERLSKERAEVVKSYLESNYNLRNIVAVGRANDQLKDPADPTAASNRRIEFIPEW